MDCLSDFIETLGLDRFLLASEFLFVCPNLVQKLGPRSLSDHNLISLEIEETDWGPVPFRFYNHWFEMKGFQEMVNRQWDSIQVRRGAEGDIRNKLRDLKLAIKGWYNRHGRMDPLKISALEEEIHNLELEKSREKWVRERDKNTKFFHLSATVRRKKNSICCLNVDNNEIKDPVALKKAIVDYFESHFQSFDTVPIRDIDCQFPQLSDSRIILRCRFSRIFALSCVKERKVKDFGHYVNSSWTWHIVLRRRVVQVRLGLRFGLVYYHPRLRLFPGKFYMVKWRLRRTWLLEIAVVGMRSAVRCVAKKQNRANICFSLVSSLGKFGLDGVRLGVCNGFVVTTHGNDIIFKQKVFPIEELIDLIKTRLGVWVKACWPHINILDVFNNLNSISIGNERNLVSRVVVWQKPSAGAIKFNVDGSSIGKPGLAVSVAF
ncbi:hypothetical protein PTKIN_Ptkin16aG0022500 [Pterospermum kingtungense]